VRSVGTPGSGAITPKAFGATGDSGRLFSLPIGAGTIDFCRGRPRSNAKSRSPGWASREGGHLNPQILVAGGATFAEDRIASVRANNVGRVPLRALRPVAGTAAIARRLLAMLLIRS